ncbi:MAG: polyprenol monophosphomannose synthase [Actinomycetota bacterium]|nr:polyprenol monophosphomannose synthase [Actinomycetota bacterium]
MRVVVVVPTFNEADNLPKLIDGLRDAVPTADVIVVDDNSPDRTGEVADELALRLGGVTVLHRTDKSGIGSAYRDGFAAALAAGADVVVQMDADLSHEPGDVPALVAIVEHDVDLAIGSRYVPGGRTINWPASRMRLSRWGNRYAAGALGLAVNDATGGFRAYRAEALRRMDFASVAAEGYGFQVEMTHRLIRAGGRIVEYPITFVDRRAGESKMSGGIVREALLLVVQLWVADRRGRRHRRRHGG